jgi:hypothetical protein
VNEGDEKSTNNFGAKMRQLFYMKKSVAIKPSCMQVLFTFTMLYILQIKFSMKSTIVGYIPSNNNYNYRIYQIRPLALTFDMKSHIAYV